MVEFAIMKKHPCPNSWQQKSKRPYVSYSRGWFLHEVHFCGLKCELIIKWMDWGTRKWDKCCRVENVFVGRMDTYKEGCGSNYGSITDHQFPTSAISVSPRSGQQYQSRFALFCLEEGKLSVGQAAGSAAGARRIKPAINGMNILEKTKTEYTSS